MTLVTSGQFCNLGMFLQLPNVNLFYQGFGYAYQNGMDWNRIREKVDWPALACRGYYEVSHDGARSRI